MHAIPLLASIVAAMSIVHVAALVPNIKTTTTTTILKTTTKIVKTSVAKTTSTITDTLTVSATATNTVTNTATVSTTATNTVTNTNTVTVTAPTSTITNTNTVTVTAPTSTITNTNTITVTAPTSTITNTNTVTVTATTTAGGPVYGTPRPSAILWYTTDNLVVNTDGTNDNNFLHVTSPTISGDFRFDLQRDGNLCVYHDATGDINFSSGTGSLSCDSTTGCLFVFGSDGNACVSGGPNGEIFQACTGTAGRGHSIVLSAQSPYLGVYDANGNLVGSQFTRVN